ncbi:hypothetical protein [Extibacter muris]|uniref:Uncharacterized protein n=1 Tax=Extibacter muris TaxID=1796622 RepID=A0A4R4FDK2_9FIRM|nr:hypothetical protein [Extibacter muris]MCU0080302.1 hypothetical protein [Extibacter muris]TDA21411.1 hypothetical protein E1963_12150 [Extibacter muris]
MEIKKIEEPFSVCKVKDYSKVDLLDTFSFVAKTDEELSLVCLTQSVPDNATEREDGWKTMRIQENYSNALKALARAGYEIV